jgi:hypothetical protein
MLNPFSSATVESPSGNLTMTQTEAAEQNIWAFDPGGGARTLTLPTEATSSGYVLFIANAADAAEVLTKFGLDGLENATVRTTSMHRSTCSPPCPTAHFFPAQGRAIPSGDSSSTLAVSHHRYGSRSTMRAGRSESATVCRILMLRMRPGGRRAWPTCTIQRTRSGTGISACSGVHPRGPQNQSGVACHQALDGFPSLRSGRWSRI